MEVQKPISRQVQDLLEKMTLEEKIGQMHLINGASGHIPDWVGNAVRIGETGAILNEVDVDTINELQRIAVEESRLGIPLLIGRDVIHGFKTVFPIPLGQAASWNPELVRLAAEYSAREASESGVNWTFAPMMDIGRDPRWGRIAETLGEDAFLSGRLAEAMIEGFQGSDLSNPGSIAACAKHFAGYGASESGRDYNTTNISENELRNVHLPPFRQAAKAGVASFMTSFSDLDGIPATANEKLIKGILMEEWGYEGMVVSDWDSIHQLKAHGLTADDRSSALESLRAGVAMDMNSGIYLHHIRPLIESGAITEQMVDDYVASILRMKFDLGLFEHPYTLGERTIVPGTGPIAEAAEEISRQSIVLLENREDVLPLKMEGKTSIAVIGPLADDPYEQLGTWVFDGDPDLSVTPLGAIRAHVGDSVEIRHVRALASTRSRTEEGFDEAVQAARESDIILAFLGEESILSGEAHCRADISLPGNQEDLIRVLAATGKPIVLVVMAGRPLTLGKILSQVHAVLYCWHPGTMAGPAIRSILFGQESPSGKLPVTFPQVVGQVPIYYNHKNTGRPATPESIHYIDDIESRAGQVSLGNTSFFLDVGLEGQWPFGYGLSYTTFRYSDLRLSSHEPVLGEEIEVLVRLENTGRMEATEIVQLYVRDVVGNVTRPVKELKGFERVRLMPGEVREVRFVLTQEDLAFYNRHMKLVTEPGEFHLGVGGSSTDLIWSGFWLKPA
jgi:beta-glucosidase